MPTYQKLPAMREKKVVRRYNRKLLTLLVTFFIIILFILFFNSSFSKINEIHIEGYHYLTAEEIGHAIQIQSEDHFFAVSAQEIESRVRTLSIVEDVNVTKHFPGKVSITLKEYDEVAYAISLHGAMNVVLANGEEIPYEEGKQLANKPILTNWRADDPIKKQLCAILAKIPQSYLDDISEIQPIPSVSYPDKIKLYTKSYFEVITAVEYLADKLGYLGDIIAQLKTKDIESGVLTMLLADTHAPFGGEEADGEPIDIDGEHSNLENGMSDG